MIVILSGVSGVGKTTIAKLLEDLEFTRSISYTSRAKRNEEEHGIDYIFTTREDFEEKITQEFFLEHTKQFDNFYGTAFEQIESSLNEGKKIIMCLSKEGFKAAYARWPERVLGIYLLPPDESTLQERLFARNSDDMCIRMQVIREKISKENLEKDHEGYHHKITPGTIEETLSAVLELIENFKKTN